MTITLNGTTGIVNTGSETINAQSEAIASDGKGDYIKVWNHPTLPRPTEEQLK